MEKGERFSPRKFRVKIEEIGYGVSQPIASMSKQVDLDDCKQINDLLACCKSYQEKYGTTERHRDILEL